jgi:glycosyltransferase involved in cell wall biosynthesis
MRFLIDVTDLRSPLRNKYARVLEKLLSEIATGEGLAVEIARGGHEIMAREPPDEKSGDVWSAIPGSNSLKPAVWGRAAKLMLFFFCAKFGSLFLSQNLRNGLVWNFAYSIELFSHVWRRRIAHFLELDLDAKRLSLVYFWLAERGFDLGNCLLARAQNYDPSRTISIGKGDILVLAGTSWRHDIAALEKTKAGVGFRLVCLVYDLLPIDYPSFVSVRQRDQYQKFLYDLGRAADLIVTPNKTTASRLEVFLSDKGINQIAISPISISSAALAIGSGEITGRLYKSGLAGRKFMLCVADLRERKYILWLYVLCAKLGGDRPRFPMLVFAGHMVDAEIFGILSDDPSWGKVGIFVDSPSDTELSWLYDNAELYLQPSFEGGAGMAVMEAVRYGRRCIAADAPSLVEASGGQAEHLPNDEKLWMDAILRALDAKDGSDAVELSRRTMPSSPNILSQTEALLDSRLGAVSREMQPPVVR